MQTLDEANAYTECKRLLDLDDGIFYSSFLDTSDSIVGEAIKESIAAHDNLSIMILPIRSRNSSLVLATSPGSNLTAIVEKAKRIVGI